MQHFEDGLKVAWSTLAKARNVRTGSTRELGENHWCVPGRQSHLPNVHAKWMLQERLTQWKTGSTVKLARLAHS
jgi:hypothetical protein